MLRVLKSFNSLCSLWRVVVTDPTHCLSSCWCFYDLSTTTPTFRGWELCESLLHKRIVQINSILKCHTRLKGLNYKYSTYCNKLAFTHIKGFAKFLRQPCVLFTITTKLLRKSPVSSHITNLHSFSF